MSEENSRDIKKFEQYMHKIQSITPITQEEELRLEQQIALGKEELQRDIINPHILDECRRAKQRLIEAYLTLVVDIIQQYIDRERIVQYIRLMDLVKTGNRGLQHAVETFDATKGYRFRTYVIWYIRQAVKQKIGKSNE